MGLLTSSKYRTGYNYPSTPGSRAHTTPCLSAGKFTRSILPDLKLKQAIIKQINPNKKPIPQQQISVILCFGSMIISFYVHGTGRSLNESIRF